MKLKQILAIGLICFSLIACGDDTDEWNNKNLSILEKTEKLFFYAYNELTGIDNYLDMLEYFRYTTKTGQQKVIDFIVEHKKASKIYFDVLNADNVSNDNLNSAVNSLVRLVQKNRCENYFGGYFYHEILLENKQMNLPYIEQMAQQASRVANDIEKKAKEQMEQIDQVAIAELVQDLRNKSIEAKTAPKTWLNRLRQQEILAVQIADEVNAQLAQSIALLKNKLAKAGLLDADKTKLLDYGEFLTSLVETNYPDIATFKKNVDQRLTLNVKGIFCMEDEADFFRNRDELDDDGNPKYPEIYKKPLVELIDYVDDKKIN